jgi:hypothetical protein
LLGRLFDDSPVPLAHALSRLVGLVGVRELHLRTLGYQHDQLADRLKCCPISSALEGADLFRNLTAAAPGKELLPHLREARTALFAIEKVE